MDRLYRFSQIKTQEELVIAINYVAEKATELCYKITSQTYPIDYLTIFSHYPEEFNFLKQTALEMGNLKSENHGPLVELSTPLKLTNGELKLLRIREPDPYRMQVGCSDFIVPDYQEFKNQFLGKSENLRLIERPDLELIEFFHPDFDVLAYVLSKH